MRAVLSAEEAFAEQHLRGVDLLVCDYYLVGTNALEVVQVMRDLQPDLLWILITAFGSPEMEAAAKKLGVLHIFIKPFPLDDLKRLISTLKFKSSPDSAETK